MLVNFWKNCLTLTAFTLLLANTSYAENWICETNLICEQESESCDSSHKANITLSFDKATNAAWLTNTETNETMIYEFLGGDGPNIGSHYSFIQEDTASLLSMKKPIRFFTLTVHSLGIHGMFYNSTALSGTCEATE